MRELLATANKKRRPVLNGEETVLQMPVLEEVIDMDEEVESAAV